MNSVDRRQRKMSIIDSDVSDIPKKVRSGNTIIDGLLPSHSMGKSLVSYVTGHAICEGYIDNINVKLNDWPLIKSTLGSYTHLTLPTTNSV